MGSIQNSLTGPPSVGGSLTPEPIEGNSLTRYLRSINNQQGQQGNQAFGAGTALLGQGAGIVDRGVSTFQQPLDYWSALLSGDKTAMGKAVGPYAAAVGKQFENAGRAADTTLPRGGYRSTAQAELPTQKAGLISNQLLGLQPQAAQQMTGIASLLSSLGLDVGKLGLGEQGMGSQVIGQLLQSLLTGRGQDVSEHGQSMSLAGQLGSSLIGSYVPKYGSIGKP